MASMARIMLIGGPFDGEDAALAPPDLGVPAQIVWGGWFLWGFDAWLYEWHGETIKGAGFTDALVYRPTGRHLTPEEIPPLIAEDVELWAGAPAVWAEAMRAIGIPAELLWPGL